MGLKLLDRELFDKKTFELLTDLNQDFYSFKEASKILGERISGNMRLFDNTIFNKVERKNKWFLSKETVLLLSLRNKFEGINLKGRSAYNRNYTIDFGTELKMLNRPCEICFKPPKYWEKFLDLQDNEPIILEPIIRSVDCSNIKDAKIVEAPKKKRPAWEIGFKDEFSRAEPEYDYEYAIRETEYNRRQVNAKREDQESAIKEEFNNHKFYVFKNCLYYFNSLDKHTEEEQKLLIKEHYFKQQNKFTKLQKEIRLFEKLESADIQQSRESIPEEVRFAVWRRDGGKSLCANISETLPNP